MGKIVKFNPHQRGKPSGKKPDPRIDMDALRLKRIQTIFDLMFKDGDVEAVMELYDYARNRSNTPGKRVRELLIRRGILNSDGTLSDLTNEAMYQIREGVRPPWLDQESRLM